MKLIELNFQREYLRGYFQRVLLPRTSGKMQTEKGNPPQPGGTCCSGPGCGCAGGEDGPFTTYGHVQHGGRWGCCLGALPAGVFKASCTDFYPAVRLYLRNNNVLSVQGEINTQPNLPWEYLSKFFK